MFSDDTVDVTRRRLLELVSAGVMLPVPVFATAIPAGARSEDRAILLRQLLPDLAAARRVGALYLARTPEENDPLQLWHGLFGAASPRETALCRSLLAWRITTDFRNAQVLTLHGWVLARSEARLCALSFLG